MTKHKSIDEYEEAFEEFIYPSLVAKHLGITRQAVYYRLSKNKDLNELWKDIREEQRVRYILTFKKRRRKSAKIRKYN